MPKVALTDAGIRALKLPELGGRLEITDASCRGLNLRITDKGVKTWTFMWRDKLDGKVKRLTLGRYPDISLRIARELCDARRGETDREIDPQARKQGTREAARNFVTFDTVADSYMERHAKAQKRSWRNDLGYLRAARAMWGTRDVRSITTPDVKALLNGIAEGTKDKPRPAPVSANRTQSVLHKLFAWGVDNMGLPGNPLAGVSRQGGKESPKERTLDARELKALWAALGAETITIAPAIRLALQTVYLTACRPGEVAGMTSDELYDLDTSAPEWRIPGRRTKNGRPHVVPLSTMARDVIRTALRLWPLAESISPRPVFPSKFDRTTTIARHSMSQATSRLAIDGVAPFTPHDLRRSAVTIARRLGARRDVVKALLNHAEGDVTQIYDTYDLLHERREALETISSVLNYRFIP